MRHELIAHLAMHHLDSLLFGVRFQSGPETPVSPLNDAPVVPERKKTFFLSILRGAHHICLQNPVCSLHKLILEPGLPLDGSIDLRKGKQARSILPRGLKQQILRFPFQWGSRRAKRFLSSAWIMWGFETSHSGSHGCHCTQKCTFLSWTKRNYHNHNHNQR